MAKILAKLNRAHLIEVISPGLTGHERNYEADAIARAILFDLGIKELDGSTDPKDIRFGKRL